VVEPVAFLSDGSKVFLFVRSDAEAEKLDNGVMSDIHSAFVSGRFFAADEGDWIVVSGWRNELYHVTSQSPLHSQPSFDDSEGFTPPCSGPPRTPLLPQAYPSPHSSWMGQPSSPSVCLYMVRYEPQFVRPEETRALLCMLMEGNHSDEWRGLGMW